jgi:hypothetical protein
MSALARLIVATRVAIVIAMATFVPALVVVCARFCLIARVGTALFVQVLGVLAVDAIGLEVLVFVLGGDSSCCRVCPRRDCRHRGACAACVGHADDNGGRRRIDRTTCSPYAGQREGAAYAPIIPPACGIARI